MLFRWGTSFMLGSREKSYRIQALQRRRKRIHNLHAFQRSVKMNSEIFFETTDDDLGKYVL